MNYDKSLWYFPAYGRTENLIPGGGPKTHADGYILPRGVTFDQGYYTTQKQN